MNTSTHGIKASFLVVALLGTVLSQTAFAAATVVQTVVAQTLTNSSKSSVSTYLVQSDGTPFYGSCTQNISAFTATCTATTAGFQAWKGQSNSPAGIKYKFYIPISPALASGYTPLGSFDDFGVALDGVPYDPLTGTCTSTSNGVSSLAVHTGSDVCSFRLEARLQTTQSTSSAHSSSAYMTGRLGFDSHNGHNQSSGAYHYHGIPCGMASAAGSSAIVTCSPMTASNPWASLPTSATVVGYARDGYPIVVQKNVYSSYSTVTSVAATSAGRPTTAVTCANTTCTAGNFSMDMNTLVASGSTTFTMPSNKTMADFVYNGPTGYGTGTGTNQLGLCNEAPNSSSSITTLDGKTAKYVYYLTPDYPMVPRCLIGVTDAINSSTSTMGFYHTGADAGI